MPPSVLIFAGCVGAVSFIAALAYRRLWLGHHPEDITPKGFGMLLAPALLAAAVVADASGGLVKAFALLSIASAIYWFDDLIGLSARLRLGVSFFTGALIGLALLSADESLPLWLLLLFCVAAGVFNIVVTNIVNFYDGADLNLATYIALTALAILIFMPAFDVIGICAIACLAFIVPFAVFNSRPNMIYLGDAGSFAFAGFLTVLAVIFCRGRDIAPQVAIPSALPALDTFYVLCIRIVEKHDLLTRHYLYLYQRLGERYGGFSYLLPQIVNAALCLAAVAALQDLGLSAFWSVAIAGVAVTVPFYFVCRTFLLPRRKGELP